MKILEVLGSDALKILNGLSTNLIQKQEQPIYSCVLTANGRFMFDYLLLQTPTQIFVAVNENFAQDFIKYIKMFALGGHISLQETQFYLSWNKEKGEFTDPRPQMGLWSISQTQEDLKEFHLHRISLKIADGFYDLTQKESIILDFGFDEINAINYTKGCYLGQELIARTHHTGVIRKKNYAFKSTQTLTKNTEIIQERKVGIVLGGIDGTYLANINFEKADFSKPFLCNEDNIKLI